MSTRHVHVEPRRQTIPRLRDLMSRRMATKQKLSALQNEALDISRAPISQNLLRVTVLATAIWYLIISVQAVFASMSVLRGLEIYVLNPEAFPSSLIAEYAGKSLITNSPLVKDALGGNTSPRSDVVYLESSGAHSFLGCSNVAAANTDLYSASFLRFMFAQLQNQTAYNLTLMSDLELLVPVVDCTFSGLVSGDSTMAKVYYLVRRISDPSQLLLLSISMSIQNYSVDQQHQSGPALFVMMAFLTDMAAASVDYQFAIAPNYPYESTPDFVVCQVLKTTSDGFWLVREVPIHPLIDPARDFLTAWRDGFYIDDPVSQSNVKNWHWGLQTTPLAEVANWQWYGQSLLRDSWAWAHCIHAVFAFYDLYNLLILLFVMYRSFRIGRIWIGDAFASISNSLLYRGVLVLISNQFDGYYTWTECAIAIGYSIGDADVQIHYRSELLQADILTFYLNLASVLSYATGERVNPFVAILSFILGFEYRVGQAKAFPAIRAAIVSFATENNALGEMQVSELLESLSPFIFRTVHAISMDHHRFAAIGACIASCLIAMLWVVLYVVLRKVHRRAKARTARYEQVGTSDPDKLTLFESATGSALRKRFGVIAGYANYIEVDGRRYATRDAVYGNGFVIANKKFLIASGDLMSIAMIKLTRVRFTNVFVYDLINGDTVNQTARLVYPQTIQWGDLLRLGVSKLA